MASTRSSTSPTFSPVSLITQPGKSLSYCRGIGDPLTSTAAPPDPAPSPSAYHRVSKPHKRRRWRAWERGVLNLILSNFGRCRSAKVGRKIALNSSEIRQGRRFGHASYVPRTVRAKLINCGEECHVQPQNFSVTRGRQYGRTGTGFRPAGVPKGRALRKRRGRSYALRR